MEEDKTPSDDPSDYFRGVTVLYSVDFGKAELFYEQ